MMVWQNQVAVVTGAARGIGRATARRLARQGAAVCVNYVARADAAETLVQEIRAEGGRAIAHRADVADAAQVEEMIERATRELGPVSILVNNAGVSLQATLETYDPAAMERMRRVNVDGVIHTIRATMAGMRERRYGRIVNVTSIAAIGTALPGNAFYAATKAEVAILTKRFAMELGLRGITVNAVAPGFIRTEMAQNRRTDQEWQDVARRLSERAMLGRIGEPEDIANAVAFFAAPGSGWVTGQVLAVDGGRMDYIVAG
jgi:NAD(P)-dependent dehydrogenase (short-subunit alcohol dehydrogenase family)